MRISHLSLHGSTVVDAIAMFLVHFANLAVRPPRRRSRGSSVRLTIAPEDVHREAAWRCEPASGDFDW